MHTGLVVVVVLVAAFSNCLGEDKPPMPNDKLVVHGFALGSVDDANDPSAEHFWGHDAMEMIEFIRIEYYPSEGLKHVRCVGFCYADKECNCPEEPSFVTNKVQDYRLDRDDYVNEVRGNYFLNIGSIYFKTKKGKEIGPYGTETDKDKLTFRASYNEAPLLYAEGYRGLWVYYIKFYFHDKDVLDLEDIANEVAKETYSTLKGTIADIFEIRDNYQRMLPDVARKGCYKFEEDQDPDAGISCDLQALLDQINILATDSLALRKHDRRDLLELKDYDSSKYLEEVKEAKKFHELVTGIKFDLNTVIDVIDEQSDQLNRYFSTSAAFDIAIAEQDYLYIKGAIADREEAIEETLKVINVRFDRILGVGVSLAATEVIDKAFRLGTVIAANMNPFKWIFGGPDIDAIYDAVDDLMDAVSDLIMLATLLGRLDEFLSHSIYVVDQLAVNSEQILAMEYVVGNLTEETDPDVIEEMSKLYIQKYGEYTPMVTEGDMSYATTLLGAIADESCSIIGDFTGMIDSILGSTYAPAELDCQFIQADIAVLESHFSDVYTLQFELIDALTSIVKGSIAKANAERIGSIEKTIDVRTAAIGTAIQETRYQAASMGRCNVLEYIEAGKRPNICKKLLFQDMDIDALIAYEGSSHTSDWFSFATLPIGHDSDDVTIPYVNITNLIRGSFQTLRLPASKKQWLMDHGWLPSVMDEESVFYYSGMEMYIPGIKCNETDESVHIVNVRSLTANPADLYSQDAPPKYNADKQMTVFEYEQPTVGACPGEKQEFPVYNGDTGQKVYDQEVCVTSPGMVTDKPKNDFTYPSVFNTWIISVFSQKGCTLVMDEDFPFTPMVTVRLMMKQVFVKKDPSDDGIDHCWPEDSRCEPHEWCKNLALDYECHTSKRFIYGEDLRFI